MRTTTTESKQLDIFGTGNPPSAREVFAAVLKQWRKRLGYFSIFAAAPALLVSHVQEAHSDEVKGPEKSDPGHGARGLLNLLTKNTSNRALLNRQSGFRLPHQNGNFAVLSSVAGNDNCPGRVIPGGSYTAALPYTDTGDTTGANNTIARLSSYYYYQYNDTEGPDHVYSFTLTGRGPNSQIRVSTTSGSYKPLIYVLYGGYLGACPGGTGNTAFFPLATSESSMGTATVSADQMSVLPLGVPLHLFIDSKFNDATGAGPYTLEMQDVTISSVECANNIDCPLFFVRQQYVDFLKREPDPPGLAAWLTLLNNCLPGDTSCDRIHVSSAFFQSPEFQGRGYFLYRFYNVAFGRKPDFDEFEHDMGYVSGFRTDADLEMGKINFMRDFMARPAFRSKYNSINNTQFVDTLLAEAGVTHPARDFWITALNNGSRARYEVMRELVESTQVYQKYYNQAFVVMQYFGYLRRQPDALYLNWIDHLDATGDSRSMIDGFINSQEYRNRFGQ